MLPAGCERSRAIAFRHAVTYTAALEQSIIALFIINLIVVLRVGTAMGFHPTRQSSAGGEIKEVIE